MGKRYGSYVEMVEAEEARRVRRQSSAWYPVVWVLGILTATVLALVLVSMAIQ